MGSQTLATEMHRLGAAFLLVGSASAFPMAFPDGPQGPLPIPRPGSDGSYAGDNYFQYINVPAHRPLSGATDEATPTITGRVPQPEGPHIQGKAEVARFLRWSR